jgi:hypothetical protein
MALYARNETRHFVNAAHYRLYYLGSFGFALGGAVVAGSIAVEPHLKRRSAVLASLLAVDAVVLFMVPQLSTFRTTAVDTAPVEFLREHLGLQRFYTLGPIAPNYGSYFGIASINEANLPVPKAWGFYEIDHLDANTTPLAFSPDYRTNPDGPSVLDEFKRNLRNFAGIGTKYLVTTTDAEQAKQVVAAGLRQAFDDGQVSIFEVPYVTDYFHTVDPMCQVKPLNWQAADVSCAGPSTLVRLELSDPGWSATRNGADAKVSTYGEIFQSVDVPAGTSRVTFDYAPQHILLAWLAALAALVWIAAWRLWLVREEPATDDASP